MANFYLAASLAALRGEVNAAWPNRDKASDGWVGDTSHAARPSDHNPDWGSNGVVRALDIDKDGVDMAVILDGVVGDPRAAYVIWNGRIASATYGWKWRTYSGSNPHDKHVHISIKHTNLAESATTAWLVPDKEEEDDMSDPAVLAALKELVSLQQRTNNLLTFQINQLKAIGAIEQREEARDIAEANEPDKV